MTAAAAIHPWRKHLPAAAAFDRAAVKTHVEMLHQLARASGIEGVLILTRIEENPLSDKKGNPLTDRFQIGDVTGMVDAIMARQASPNLNIYLPWAIFRCDISAGRKGGEADVVAVLAFVADLDSDTGKAGNGLPIEAPYVIETSAGNAQPVFPLARALPGADAKVIAVALADVIGCDSRTKDISGVWRIPGTLNWPTRNKLQRGRSPNPQPVKAVTAWTGELIDPDKLRTALASYIKPTTPANDIEQSQASRQSPAALFDGLPSGLKKQIAASPYVGEDTSKTAASVIVQLRARGCSDEDITVLFKAYPEGIGKRYAEGKDLDSELRRTEDKWGKGASDAQGYSPLVATEYVWRDPAKIPPRDFLYGKHLIRKFLSGKVSQGGVGKSSLITAETLAMTSGKNLLGVAPSRRLRVWLWNLEDPKEETERKIQAAALHYNLSGQDIESYLFVDSGRDQKLVIAETTRDGAKIVRPVVDSLIEQIIARNIDVLIIDPFVSSHHVVENSNDDMDLVVKEWSAIAEFGNCAVELVHHSKKGELEKTVESSRGAIAITDACRSVQVLNRMTKDEAERAGVQNHRLYFRVYADKANLAPPVETSNWFKLESVDLGNGPYFGGMGGDEVGVVVAWRWPDAMAGITDADFEKVAAEIRGGKWRENYQAKDWAGYAVAKALNLDAGSKAGRAKISAMLKVWLAAGSLAIVDGFDEKSMPKKFVEVAENG